MTAVGIAWVVLSPYGTALLIAWSRLANRLVTRSIRASTALGWSAIGALLAGVFAVGGHGGMTMALLSAPFGGLAVWKPGPGRGQDDGPEPEPEGAPPLTDAVTRSGRRVPAPARKRPTGHRPVPQRPRTPAR